MSTKTLTTTLNLFRAFTNSSHPRAKEMTQIPSLPDDLLLSIFARVSRLYYPTLSLVSKSFQSLLALPVLYRNRSALGRAERCLYVCIRFPRDDKARWFTLCQKPKQTLINDTEKKSSGSGNILIPLQTSHEAPWECMAAIGSNIYVANSSSLSILDCRTHTWREGPSMRVKRNGLLSVSVVDGKIYVAGGCKDSYSSDWMEVFDLKTQAWESVPSTIEQRQNTRSVLMSVVIDGEIRMFGFNRKLVVYKPKEDRWEAMQAFPESHEVIRVFSWCVIDNVLYAYSYRDGIQWFNFKIGEWNTLKGYNRFPGMPKTLDDSRVKLVDCSGKMAVLWHEKPHLDSRAAIVSEGTTNRILWCGVIKLIKFKGDEISGEVEWFDPVLTVPKSCVLEDALCATV